VHQRLANACDAANRPGDVVRVEYYQMSGERMPADGTSMSAAVARKHGRLTADATLRSSVEDYRLCRDLSADDVRGMWAYSDADIQGRFRCSNGLLNEIYAMCVRSASQNVQQGMISTDANANNRPGPRMAGISAMSCSTTIMAPRSSTRSFMTMRWNSGPTATSMHAVRRNASVVPEWSMYCHAALATVFVFG